MAHKHSWSAEPPVAGETYCKDLTCGKIWTGVGRPRGSKNAAKPIPSPSQSQSSPTVIAGAAEVAANLTGNDLPEIETVDMGGDMPTPLGEMVPSPPQVPTWCGHAGKRLARMFVDVNELVAARVGREVNEPEDEDVDEFGAALGEQLSIWFPASELTPATRLMIAGAAIAGSMHIGAKKIERPVVTPVPQQEQAQPVARPSQPVEKSVSMRKGLLD